MTLSLKIPPVLVTLFFGIIMFFIATIRPAWQSESLLFSIAGGIVALSGLLLILVGAVFFRREDTTVNPIHPEEATALVTKGLYRYTRNPMYLGMLLILLGWGLFLAHPLNMITAVLFVPYMNQFQIKPEELALSQLFGSSYHKYCAQVRRWI